MTILSEEPYVHIDGTCNCCSWRSWTASQRRLRYSTFLICFHSKVNCLCSPERVDNHGSYNIPENFHGKMKSYFYPWMWMVFRLKFDVLSDSGQNITLWSYPQIYELWRDSTGFHGLTFCLQMFQPGLNMEFHRTIVLVIWLIMIL